jgi:hypothetical protein
MLRLLLMLGAPALATLSPAYGQSPQAVTLAPSGSSSNALAPTALGSAGTSLVLKAKSGILNSWEVQAGASAGFALIIDEASDSGNGAVTPVKCYALAANSWISSGAVGGPPLRFFNGITVVFSTTGCFTETQSSTAFISGEAY